MSNYLNQFLFIIMYYYCLFLITCKKQLVNDDFSMIITCKKQLVNENFFIKKISDKVELKQCSVCQFMQSFPNSTFSP